MSDRLITTTEAAGFLGVQPCTLEAWRCRGGGPRFVRLGRAIRYRTADLEQFIESRTCRNTSERGAA